MLTWNQIYREAGHAAGVEPDLIHIPSDLIAAYDPGALGSLVGDKANSVVFDNRKIRRFVPDFVATVPWFEGVRRAIAWHEADPARRTIDDEANRLWDTIIAAYERAFPSLDGAGEGRSRFQGAMHLVYGTFQYPHEKGAR